MRDEIDVDTIAHVYFVMAKRQVEEKRRRAQAERERRRQETRNED